MWTSSTRKVCSITIPRRKNYLSFHNLMQFRKRNNLEIETKFLEEGWWDRRRIFSMEFHLRIPITFERKFVCWMQSDLVRKECKKKHDIMRNINLDLNRFIQGLVYLCVYKCVCKHLRQFLYAWMVGVHISFLLLLMPLFFLNGIKFINQFLISCQAAAASRATKQAPHLANNTCTNISNSNNINNSHICSVLVLV